MKLVIAGSRNTHHPDAVMQVKAALAAFTEVYGKPSEIHTGCARGIDFAAISHGRGVGYEVTRHAADWFHFGNSAGPRRNAEMAEIGDVLLAIWDGESKGTKNMISQMVRRGKPVLIVRPHAPGLVWAVENIAGPELCRIKKWRVGTVLENQDGCLLKITKIPDFGDINVLGCRCQPNSDQWSEEAILLLRGNENRIPELEEICE